MYSKIPAKIKTTSFKIPGIKTHGDSISNTATARLIPSGDISLQYKELRAKKQENPLIRRVFQMEEETA